MKSFLKQVFFGTPTTDSLVEGVYADQYSQPEVRARIKEQYLKRWHPEHQPKTPLSHPWLFDPLNPPQGWIYDPYYELWLNIKD